MKQLSHITAVFRVADMARSLDFYRERLGFELEFLYENFYGSVRRGGCHIHLQCGSPAARYQAAFERGELLDACVVIRDAHELSASFAAASVPLRKMPYGTEFYVRAARRSCLRDNEIGSTGASRRAPETAGAIRLRVGILADRAPARLRRHQGVRGERRLVRLEARDS